MPSISSRGIKTIRGTLEVNGPLPVEKLVFSYESPDRTRGWRVDGAWLWIANPETTVAGSGNALLMGNLATDTYFKNIRTIIDPDDNRSIGWHSKQYHTQNGIIDFWYPNATDTSQSEFLLDLERIITNELYISAAVATAVSVPPPIRVGYMIVLKEVSLSAGQSLLQQLKGVGQNIDN